MSDKPKSQALWWFGVNLAKVTNSFTVALMQNSTKILKQHLKTISLPGISLYHSTRQCNNYILHTSVPNGWEEGMDTGLVCLQSWPVWRILERKMLQHWLSTVAQLKTCLQENLGGFNNWSVLFHRQCQSASEVLRERKATSQKDLLFHTQL